jgi:hypothetical protein
VQVELGDSLLSTQGPDVLLLVGICAFGYMGRHRVIPLNRGRWDEWAKQLPATLADELRLVWDEGEQQVALGAASERLEVRANAKLSFECYEILASPQDAFALLGRPLRVLLENGRNDRLFLLAFADAATLNALKRAEDAGWLVFETAGGIGELKVRLEKADEVAPLDAMRMMYLCDSDAREPGGRSAEATTVQSGLEGLEQRYRRQVGYFGCVLSRRSAENYAPPRAVLQWAKSHAPDAWRLFEEASQPRTRDMLARNPSRGSTHGCLLAAIALNELSPEIRAHIDMKSGRGEASIRTIDAIWGRLNDFQQAALQEGFGSRFAASFFGDSRGLSDETGEVIALLQRILERL